jgi:hypothetical protein
MRKIVFFYCVSGAVWYLLLMTDTTITTTIKLTVSINHLETLTENEVGEFVFDLFWKLLPKDFGQETDLSYVEVENVQNVDGDVYEMEVALDLENGATVEQVVEKAIGGCPDRWDSITVTTIGFEVV